MMTRKEKGEPLYADWGEKQERKGGDCGGQALAVPRTKRVVKGGRGMLTRRKPPANPHGGKRGRSVDTKSREWQKGVQKRPPGSKKGRKERGLDAQLP